TAQRGGERCAVRTRLREQRIRHRAGATHVTQSHGVTQQAGAGPDGHGGARRRDVGHVATLTDHNAQSTALTDRERVDTVVRADDEAAFVDDRSRAARDARAEEGLSPAPRDEADVHALPLVGRTEGEPAGALADLGLRQLAYREQRVRELMHTEHVE